MDGMLLYEYTCKGIPLLQPIGKHPVTVHLLELVEWRGSVHPHCWLEKEFSPEQERALAQSLSSVDPAASTPITTATTNAEKEEACKMADSKGSSLSDDILMAFVLQICISGGTYVCSIVHDLAPALGSARCAVCSLFLFSFFLLVFFVFSMLYHSSYIFKYCD